MQKHNDHHHAVTDELTMYLNRTPTMRNFNMAK